MNNHLKLAYDHGVQLALQEAGITKTAIPSYSSESTSNYGDPYTPGEEFITDPDNPIPGWYHTLNIEESRPGLLGRMLGASNAVLPSEVDALREALLGIKGVSVSKKKPGEEWVEWGHPRGTDEEQDAYFAQMDAAVKKITGR